MSKEQETRCAWIAALQEMGNPAILDACHQALIDVLDIVEQDQEEHVILAALAAFDNARARALPVAK